MKRKKWSELEEQTLLSKYSELLNSGTLSKLKTREKKFKPISDHVNSLHHLQDPITFPFKWSWRDASIKVQNMRHQYLGVKQKIRINSSNEFNWGDGEIHWENFLKYKEVFGDIELSPDIGAKDVSNGQVKKFGEEGVSDILGYEIESEDIEDEDELDEEEEEQERFDLGASDESEEMGKGLGNQDLVKGFKGRNLKILGAKVLELRNMICRREEKRRDRDWSRDEMFMEKEALMKERYMKRAKMFKEREEQIYRNDMEFEETAISLAKRDFENRRFLEREIDEERRRRMKWEEKWEEEEMKWRERMVEMQMEHEKQILQIHADFFQSQMQILGVMARLVCQFFGSTSDGLGGGLGSIPIPPQVLQNLQHPGGLGDGGKPDSTSPSDFIWQPALLLEVEDVTPVCSAATEALVAKCGTEPNLTNFESQGSDGNPRVTAISSCFGLLYAKDSTHCKISTQTNPVSFRFRSGRSIKKFGMTSPPILALVLPSDTGRVLSIQSHTVQGYVGNKSAVFPLQLLGYDVDPINSVQFSNHTGYPTFKGQVLNGDQLWNLIEGLEANKLLYYTHLLTGYIGSVSFLNTVLKVVDKLRSINPELIFVCDPVLGDEGKLYVPQELVSVYREKVVPVASMLTPNQFEAELLTSFRILSEQDGREACNILHTAGPSKVVITSINIDGNLLLIGSHQKEKGQPPAQFRILIPKIPAYFTGTGDLMTALLLGWSNKYPDNLEKAAELSVSSLQALLARTLNDYKRAGHDCGTSSLEIRLIQSQDDIRNPKINYTAETYN